MQRQTYAGDVTWIIVDDCYPLTTDNVGEGFKDKWTIVKVYPTPVWSGGNTQGRNMKAGVDVMKQIYKDIKAIFIIEDDDYYRANYLERMMSNINRYSLIGEHNTIYYNVYHRRYITNPNTKHASLFQTAFTYDALPFFESTYQAKFMDCLLWQRVANKYLFYENDLAIGMKGMPGRGGIGAGHSKAMNMRDDQSMNYLKRLIGDDYRYYENFYITKRRQPLFR
jgi:hypothetical protein